MAKYGYCPPSRYRGSRGPSKLLILVVCLAALLAAGLAVHVLPPLPAAATPAPARPSLSAVRVEPEPTATPLPTPPQVKGIYISGPVAGSSYMETLTQLVADTELNAAVIDVKNDEGNLTYRAAGGTAAELGACIPYIQDLPGLVSGLKAQGVYTIARVVAFKDPVLAQARPELALRYKDGSPLSEGGDLAWVNPYEREVWDYLTEIALGAAQAGFDEVQFDYVRFPTVRDLEAVDFGPSAGETTREEAVAGFLEHVRAALHDAGVWLSADVFGTVIDSSLDARRIGQSYTGMARCADFVCPMVYPSHYAAGAYGLELPDREPYQTVFHALQRSQAALAALPQEERAGVRAWLQDFTATWVKGHIPYGGEELRAQIQAVYDAGYTDWILWNAQNTYSAEGLLPAVGAE